MIYRRYCLLERLYARAHETGFEAFWHKRQIDEPGTPFPEDFPLVAELAPVGYVALEDLEGACEDELVDAGLEPQYARRVIEAYSELTTT